MSRPIRILHLEDDPHDVELVRARLDGEGLACETVPVDSRDSFEAALSQGGFDLIICDFKLPAFDGFSASDLVRGKGLDLPIIFLSGTAGEETAVEALKHGANDYLLKGRLTRLGHAIRRALAETEERRHRQRAEAALRETQKLEAIGRLAGGVAHDFNNLLTLITGQCRLLAKRHQDDATTARKLDMIQGACTRAAALTRQLLTFGQQHTSVPTVLDVNRQIAALTDLLKPLLGERVTLILDLAPAGGAVLMDPTQFEQVIMNLAINARDAMPEGGNLSIATAPETVGDGTPGLAPGAYARLTVRDTGTGMDETVQARLFEPYFTTKERGKGTGLGLATVYGIVTQAGGRITVSSRIGQGSEFAIRLPAAQTAGREGSARPPAEAVTDLRGTETILFVDDDASLRTLALEVLRQAGYRVFDAVDGAEAVRLCRTLDDRVHLLITDLIMPQMGGADLARHLTVQWPWLKVLFITGYSDHKAEDLVFPGQDLQVLHKPFTPEILLRRIRDIMDQPKRAQA